MNALSLLARVGLVAVVATVAGCSDGPKFAPVTGTVTHHGSPLVGATVVFTPTAPAEGVGAATAVTGPDGRFQLQTNLPGGVTHTGAAHGTYKVTVSKFVPPSGMSEEEYTKKAEAEQSPNKPYSPTSSVPPKVEFVPKEFSNLASTKVEATVGSGTNDVQIVIP